MDTDLSIRIAAINWLAEMTRVHGDVLPRTLLVDGFLYSEQRIPLISPQGIFKPKVLDLPLSISTTPEGPYEDSISRDGLLLYKYRGTDPNHRDNVGLRRLLELNRPLVYLYGVVPGKYLGVWPVFIVRDNPARLAFTVAVDDLASIQRLEESVPIIAEGVEARRAYATSLVRVRLHQGRFRERVIQAYRSQCAFCRLRHRELLDAAHIIPDLEEAGEPTVNNGIALCKLHHAAFDRFMVGVSPDYVIHVRQDILDEEDEPMLLHGLQELNEIRLLLPRQELHWPSPDALAWRFERFMGIG